MKYFIDTEFLEGKQIVDNIKTKPTIDLISIGIVDDKDNEYYAICREFNLQEAWNRYDKGKDGEKIYWLRDNVLLPIHLDLIHLEGAYKGNDPDMPTAKIMINLKGKPYGGLPEHYTELEQLITKYGKTEKIIAKEVLEFIDKTKDTNKTEFYGYYCDYDWVRFCWLFGKMKDLPQGFPMYCKDLKQTYDRFQTMLKSSKPINKLQTYPTQTDEHNALSDANWNKELYQFFKRLEVVIKNDLNTKPNNVSLNLID